MISNDNGDELEAVHAYNNAIKLAREVGDQGSVELLTKILKNGRRSCRLGRNTTCAD